MSRRLGDMNPANMLGPGDLSSYNDPQNAVDGPEPCEACDGEGCQVCDSWDDRDDYDPSDAYDDGREGE